MKQQFKAKLTSRGPGGAWTFLPIPFEVEKVFGSKARVPVRGTLNGFAFRNSLMPEGDGTHSMMVGKTLQKGAAAVAGDMVSVVMELDDAPRTVAVPQDFQAELARHPAIDARFAAMSYSMRKEYVEWIDSAKKPETREKRIKASVEMLADGKRPKS